MGKDKGWTKFFSSSKEIKTTNKSKGNTSKGKQTSIKQLNRHSQ